MKLTQPQRKTQWTVFFTVVALISLIKASFFHKWDAVGLTVYQVDTGRTAVMISPNITVHFPVLAPSPAICALCLSNPEWWVSALKV